MSAREEALKMLLQEDGSSSVEMAREMTKQHEKSLEMMRLQSNDQMSKIVQIATMFKDLAEKVLDQKLAVVAPQAAQLHARLESARPPAGGFPLSAVPLQSSPDTGGGPGTSEVRAPVPSSELLLGDTSRTGIAGMGGIPLPKG